MFSRASNSGVWRTGICPGTKIGIQSIGIPRYPDILDGGCSAKKYYRGHVRGYQSKLCLGLHHKREGSRLEQDRFSLGCSCPPQIRRGHGPEFERNHLFRDRQLADGAAYLITPAEREANNFGAWTTDRTAVEVKNIYIDVGLPYFGIPGPLQ